jgi:hypothetical protein
MAWVVIHRAFEGVGVSLMRDVGEQANKLKVRKEEYAILWILAALTRR